VTAKVRLWRGDTIGLGRCAVAALGLVTLGHTLAWADGQEELSPAKVRLEVGVQATMSGATSGAGSMIIDKTVGDTLLMSASVQLTPSPDGEGCGTTVVTSLSPVRELTERSAVAWEARVTVRNATLERIELDVEWKRYLRSAGGEPRRVAGGRRSVALREDEHHLLDFVPVEELTGRGSCHSLALELKASVAEDPALASRRISYDLWLVDDGPGGRSATRRWRAVAKHGEAREFEFEPLRRHMKDGSGATDAVGAQTHVGGHLRGRMMSDGSLEVALLAWRRDLPSERHWLLGGSGEKLVRVAAGETIRLELPTPKRAQQTSAESAAEIEAKERVLAILRERTVSLVLTARPVD